MLPGVPFISGLAKTDEERKILDFIFSPISLGQPYLAPPGIPPAEVAELRQAFAATMKDPDFLADNEKLDFDIDPISAEDITRSLTRRSTRRRISWRKPKPRWCCRGRRSDMQSKSLLRDIRIPMARPHRHCEPKAKQSRGLCKGWIASSP